MTDEVRAICASILATYFMGDPKEEFAMIQITEPITLEQILPIVQKLPKVEREQLRKILETEPVSWEDEWQQVVTHFQAAFANAPEAEAERDLMSALAEVRREKP